MTPKLQFQIADRVAFVTLNRPEKLNALDPEMLDGLEELIRQTDADATVRVLVLTGTGDRAFCVGADINCWAELKPSEMWATWVRRGHQVFQQLADLRQPVICVLNGSTFGGGLELALAADLRIAAASVELAAPEVKLGTFPGWGGTGRLTQLIGPSRAKRMIFTGERVSAAQALAWGLIDYSVPRQELSTAAEALAETVAGNSPIAIQLAKQAINATLPPPPSRALESMGSFAAATTKDAREGLAAFREKRLPQFLGQ